MQQWEKPEIHQKKQKIGLDQMIQLVLKLQSTFYVQILKGNTSYIILLAFPYFWYYHIQIAPTKKKQIYLYLLAFYNLYSNNWHQYMKFKKLGWLTHHIEILTSYEIGKTK